MITEDKKLKEAGFYWRERDQVRALICAPLEHNGFTNAFSTRLGGVSPMPQDALNLAGFNEDEASNIHENRRRFLQLFEGEWRLTGVWQMHSAEVRVIRDMEDALSDTERCDAITTRAANILLAVKTADCVPVILGDTHTGAVASVHAGWRGTLAEIVGRTIERMTEEFGTKASDLRAAIGPAAGACCYEVGPEVVEVFRERFPHAIADLFTPTHDGHALVDLQRANRDQLIAAGVEPERIHIAPLCTMCRTDLFFSYRREKSLYGRTGRLMSVIGRARTESD
jgi:YfiH family protein